MHSNEEPEGIREEAEAGSVEGQQGARDGGERAEEKEDAK